MRKEDWIEIKMMIEQQFASPNAVYERNGRFHIFFPFDNGELGYWFEVDRSWVKEFEKKGYRVLGIDEVDEGYVMILEVKVE